MEIIISGRHYDVTPAVKEYAHSRADKLIRYFDGITKITVTLGSDSGHFFAEMIISARRHLVLIGEVHHRDMNAAIDLVTDKMERQLTKQKEKIKNHRDRHHLGEVSPLEMTDADTEEAEGEGEDEA